jgi:hypothetical protein
VIANGAEVDGGTAHHPDVVLPVHSHREHRGVVRVRRPGRLPGISPKAIGRRCYDGHDNDAEDLVEISQFQELMDEIYGQRDRERGVRQRSRGSQRKLGNSHRPRARETPRDVNTSSAMCWPGLHHWRTSSACH